MPPNADATAKPFGSSETFGRDLAQGLRTPQVLLAAGVSALLFWWLGDLIRFPHDGPFDASLFHQPLAVAKILLVATVLWLLVAIGTLVAGRVRYDAGWGAAVVGLLALRWRGGSSFYTYDDRAAGVFATMTVELVVLALLAGIAWVALHWLRERGSQTPGIKRILELPDPNARLDDRKATKEPLDQKLLALAISTGVCGVTVTLLARTQNETQVAFAVGIGGWLGAVVAHGFISTRPGPWFWAGPILAGLIGYIVAWFTTPSDFLAVGEPGGPLAALARPMPLDWIAAGVPMALVGYVRSRTKQLQNLIEVRRSTPADS